MPFSNLNGISGLIVFLNHPLRESKAVNFPEGKIAYNRLIAEARAELEKYEPRSNFIITTEKRKNEFFVALEGDFDATCSELFEKAVVEKLKYVEDKIIFDFKKLRYVNSTALGLLLGCFYWAKTHNKNCVSRNMNENIYEICEIIGVLSLINLEEDENETEN